MKTEPETQRTAGELQSSVANAERDVSARPKALVIDDDPVMVGLLERYLARAGYATITSTDAPQGVALAVYHQPAVILMDVMMPKMSGLAALRLIRQAEGASHIPVIVITANGQAENRQEALAAGAAAFLVKPFALAQFLAEVSRAVGKPS